MIVFSYSFPGSLSFETILDQKFGVRFTGTEYSVTLNSGHRSAVTGDMILNSGLPDLVIRNKTDL